MEEVEKRYKRLSEIETKTLEIGENYVKLQHNPSRLVSTGASISKADIEQRPCFLCKKQRPEEQLIKRFDSRFEILVNPFQFFLSTLQLHLHNINHKESIRI